MAEIATALYTRHLKFDAADPLWPDRDRVVLSNGHGSMLLYALLHLTGYAAFPIEQIRTFRDFGSRCEGHPERHPARGIEVTTGPLGQGIANAMGMAVAEAFMRARFGAGLVDHHTYAFVGDGCLQEGIGQEMLSLAGHLRLGRLVLLWDDNRITDDGATDLSISEDVAERCRVAGWHVVEVDGHDVDAVSAALVEAKVDPRPSLLACRTVIARGVARLQGQRGGHSARLHPEDAEAARRDLGWPHGSFDVPEPVRQAWRAAGRRLSPGRVTRPHRVRPKVPARCCPDSARRSSASASDWRPHPRMGRQATAGAGTAAAREAEASGLVSASKVTTHCMDGCDTAYSNPVCRAAPWPRFTGCRTTTAPASCATSAPPSVDPSSTTTTCGK